MVRNLCAGAAAAMVLIELAACSSVGSGHPGRGAPGDGGSSSSDPASDSAMGDSESSSDGSSPGSSSGSSEGGYASVCPVFSGQPTCPATSDANGCNLSLGYNCAADALPQGLSCSGTSQCQARIGPVDGCGRVDGWICSCIDSSWWCDDCAIGGASCEGGAGAYELPDGGAH